MSSLESLFIISMSEWYEVHFQGQNKLCKGLHWFEKFQK